MVSVLLSCLVPGPLDGESRLFLGTFFVHTHWCCFQAGGFSSTQSEIYKVFFLKNPGNSLPCRYLIGLLLFTFPNFLMFVIYLMPNIFSCTSWEDQGGIMHLFHFDLELETIFFSSQVVFHCIEFVSLFITWQICELFPVWGDYRGNCYKCSQLGLCMGLWWSVFFSLLCLLFHLNLHGSYSLACSTRAPVATLQNLFLISQLLEIFWSLWYSLFFSTTESIIILFFFVLLAEFTFGGNVWKSSYPSSYLPDLEAPYCSIS